MLNDEWCQSELERIRNGQDFNPLRIFPRNPTKSGSLFIREATDTISAVTLLFDASTVADNATHIFKLISERSLQLPSGFDIKKPPVEVSGPYTARVREVLRVVSEMTLVRSVDNMTTYFSEVIRECFSARPELLRSTESVTYEAALACESIDELRALLVDEKVEDLARKGFKDLAGWMNKRLSVRGLDNLPARKALLEIVELRNCIVHNRSRISPKFLRITGSTEHQRGERIEVCLEHMFLAAQATAECVCHIDNALSSKFGIGEKQGD